MTLNPAPLLRRSGNMKSRANYHVCPNLIRIALLKVKTRSIKLTAYFT